jgi:alpha-amylase
MPTADIRAILDLVVGQPFIYQEVTDPAWAEPYYPNGIVTEFQFSRVVSRLFHEGPIARLHGEASIWQDVPFLPSNEALVFIDNRDNQRSHGDEIVTYKDGALHDLAMAFMLAYPYGEARVMSSYAFEEDRQGPPMDADEAIKPVHSGQGLNCGRGEWVCEHRHPAIAGMVGFRRYTASETYVSNWWTDGSNRIAFGRGAKGFIVINREDGLLSETLQTGLAPGRYCDVISGERADGACTGGEVTVAEDGTARFQVPPMTAVALHLGVKHDPD